jgi:hypothetical protein
VQKSLVLAVCSLTFLGAAKAPRKASTPPYSAIYCEARPHNEFRMFVGKEMPDGRLRFEVSRWLPDGALTGDGGIAEREGDHWVYDRRPDEFDDPKDFDRCRLHIWLRKGGVPDVIPDKSTECLGGHRSPMERVTFSSRSYYKRVTHELDPGQSPDEDDACRGSPAEKN